MKTRKIILLLILGMVSVRLFAQKKSSDNFYTSTYDAYKWYSDIFDALDSPPVKNIPDGVNAVRLISISSDPCYIICLVWTKDIRVIVFTEGDVDGTKIVRKKTLAVSDESVKELLALIEEKDFYNQTDYVNVSGRDGETWFVEANIDGKYKAVERFMLPHKTDFLRAIGRKLLRMADEGLSDEELEKSQRELEEYQNSIKLLKKKR